MENEIYRGASAPLPVTLTEDRRPTAELDTPATFLEKPTAGAQPKPAKSKARRIVKAIKLLAACIAAVTMFVTVTGMHQGFPRAELLWPWIGPDTYPYGYAHEILSKNGGVAQFAIGEKAYRITASRGDLCFFWHRTGATELGRDVLGAAEFSVGSLTEKWEFSLSISLTEQRQTESNYVSGKISSTTGETFYLYGRSYLTEKDEDLNTTAELQGFLDSILPFLTITEAEDTGWGKVLVSRTMYSDVNAKWSGLSTVEDHPWSMYAICAFSRTGVTEEYFVEERIINDIHWKFYFEPFRELVWAVPQQENNVAFGASHYELGASRYTGGMARGGLEYDDDWNSGNFDDMVVMYDIPGKIDMMARGLENYHIWFLGTFVANNPVLNGTFK